MIKKCFDCEFVKRGCKKINHIYNPNFENRRGEYVCRSCLNFSRKMQKEYEGGFYDVIEEVK